MAHFWKGTGAALSLLVLHLCAALPALGCALPSICALQLTSHGLLKAALNHLQHRSVVR